MMSTDLVELSSLIQQYRCAQIAGGQAAAGDISRDLILRIPDLLDRLALAEKIIAKLPPNACVCGNTEAVHNRSILSGFRCGDACALCPCAKYILDPDLARWRAEGGKP